MIPRRARSNAGRTLRLTPTGEPEDEAAVKAEEPPWPCVAQAKKDIKLREEARGEMKKASTKDDIQAFIKPISSKLRRPAEGAREAEGGAEAKKEAPRRRRPTPRRRKKKRRRDRRVREQGLQAAAGSTAEKPKRRRPRIYAHDQREAQ